MTLDGKLFRSKLAWRFFAMFIACALIPIGLLAGMTYAYVSGELEAQAFERLRRTAKAHALSIYERLELADSQLALLAGALARSPSDPALSKGTVLRTERNLSFFDGLGIVDDQGRFELLWGPDNSRNGFDAETQAGMALSETFLAVFADGDEAARVAIFHPLPASGDTPRFWVATLNSAFVWGLDNGSILSAEALWALWDHRGRTLFSSLPPTVRPQEELGPSQQAAPAGQIELHIDQTPYYAGYWTLFIKPRFKVPSWTVIVLEPKAQTLAPVSFFRSIFALVVLMSVTVVILMSSVAIRKSLVPIDALMQGARQVARREFSHRVKVSSNDEFQDLAKAFNQMSDQLDKQFKAILARSDLDHAILSVLDTEAIVEIMLRNLGVFSPCQTGSISLLDQEHPNQGCTYLRPEESAAGGLIRQQFTLNAKAAGILADRPEWLIVDATDDSFSFVKALGAGSSEQFILLPVYIQARLIALVALGVGAKASFSELDFQQAKPLAHHLAVAFSNADLIRELKALNMGTLNALARTVDAKSPWTAGHSERVMQMALQIAEKMGLSNQQLADIHHAALLHDIGKIGVPASILDKVEPLTPEEFKIIQTHPSTGARILSPIRAYQKLIPIVAQHHERYDGKGYPRGLEGEQIDLAARIMAAADAFDAMVSDRPYRKGMPIAKVHRIMQQEAGRQFDPMVVAALEQVIVGDSDLKLIPTKSVDGDDRCMPGAAAQHR